MKGLQEPVPRSSENFKKMIADCEAGKIDRIIVKSISPDLQGIRWIV